MAYVLVTDTYIEKKTSINEEIDRLWATKALFERQDAIIVASVSCIYGLGLAGRINKVAVRHGRRSEVS